MTGTCNSLKLISSNPSGKMLRKTPHFFKLHSNGPDGITPTLDSRVHLNPPNNSKSFDNHPPPPRKRHKLRARENGKER